MDTIIYGNMVKITKELLKKIHIYFIKSIVSTTYF